MKIDHIGIAVENLNEVKEFVEKVFGKTFDEMEEVVSQKVRVGFLELSNGRIEFIEPLSPDSPVKKFLEKKGEGIHHICLEVENIKEALERLKEKGVRLVDEVPRRGSGGSSVAFLYPSHGILLELKEKIK